MATTPLHEVCRASLPRAALVALAGLRARSGVEITLEGERAWVSWPEGDEEVLRRVLPVSGVELYVRREGHWHRFGRHLPAFGTVPGGEAQPLDRVLFPAPVQPVPASAAGLRPVPLWLERDCRARRATAALCALPELAAWADLVPSARLEKLRAASRAGRVLVLGERLPPGGKRFWGENVLVPLGYRPEPDLPESALREALGAGEDELLLLSASLVGVGGGSAPRPLGVPSPDRAGSYNLAEPAKPQAADVEAVPRAAFEPLTRAGLRLALRGAGA